MEETWRDIKGFEGFYQISNFGNVKSYNKRVKNGNGYAIKKGKVIKNNLTTSGYYSVHLYDECGKRIPKMIHRLVAEHFLPNPNNYPQVNHKDENKLNNHIDNLEWCTEKYNSNYGKHHIKLSLAQPTRRTILQYDLDGKFIKEWQSNKEIIRTLKIYHALYCCKGLYKQSGGFVWKYK